MSGYSHDGTSQVYTPATIVFMQDFLRTQDEEMKRNVWQPTEIELM